MRDCKIGSSTTIWGTEVHVELRSVAGESALVALFSRSGNTERKPNKLGR